eukprot:NODE_2652_length_2172_cov_5.169682.p1 GENE.NODE_2652_length_2172_cov_5.169682~~NODE_2652_length_2172_cov_5.169682.p1  ORF type:complete len:561 (-),score=62.29 NODE_2652_length_2172_cov_5.169682:417-2099(-)
MQEALFVAGAAGVSGAAWVAYQWGASRPVVRAEKRAWVMAHSLDRRAGSPADALPYLVQTFPLNCRITVGWQPTWQDGFEYEHWFLTDGYRNLEFVAGDSPSGHTVCVTDVRKSNYRERKTIRVDAAMHKRMADVYGATNHSLLLRNSEHIVNYVVSGRWTSMQTLSEGVIGRKFLEYIEDKEHRALRNLLPEELRVESVSTGGVVSPGRVGHITYKRTPGMLDASDRKAYNIVFLGPTGAGKSSLINFLFNKHVCPTSDDGEFDTNSCTRYPRLKSSTPPTPARPSWRRYLFLSGISALSATASSLALLFTALSTSVWRRYWRRYLYSSRVADLCLFNDGLIYGNSVLRSVDFCLEVVLVRPRNMDFYVGEGECWMVEGGDFVQRRCQINVIDCIGFCDTEFSPKEVFRLIKEQVQGSCVQLNAIVICAAGKIEVPHAEAVKQLLKWLRYDPRPSSLAHPVYFVYTRCDQHRKDSVERRQGNVAAMADTLGACVKVIQLKPRTIGNLGSTVREVELNIAVGFADEATAVGSLDYERLCNTLFSTPMLPMEVDRSWCSIL